MHLDLSEQQKNRNYGTHKYERKILKTVIKQRIWNMEEIQKKMGKG